MKKIEQAVKEHIKNEIITWEIYHDYCRYNNFDLEESVFKYLKFIKDFYDFDIFIDVHRDIFYKDYLDYDIYFSFGDEEADVVVMKK